MRKALCKTVIAAGLALMGVTAQAQTTATGTTPSTTETQTTETTNPSPALASTPADKLIARFSYFTGGSEENAASLVNGLRTGSEINLTDSATASNGSTSGSVNFTSPTKPMGYGNIRIVLSLAEAQLKTEGYSQATAQQLQMVLMGDMSGSTAQSTSQAQGILTMRASGMGWGQIAQAMGFKLGPVMSGRVPLNTTAATTQSGTDSATVSAAGTTTGTTANNGRSARASGVVTASGHPAGGNSAHHSDTGRGGGGAANSGGIVTATGASVGGGGGPNYRAFSAAGNANGHAAAAGSGSASSSGAVSAHGAGHGGGNAYGRSK